MAAALPAIHNPQGKSGSVFQQSLDGGSRSPTITTATHFVPQKPRRQQHQNIESVLSERKAFLRTQQPFLTKLETSQYRNSFKHNLCLDILQAGFHKSFSELYSLIQQQCERRLSAGPESALWGQTLLENEPDKLEILKKFLTKAEVATRKDDLAMVYNCYYKLARHFQGTGDKWLTDHFFQLCLDIGLKTKTDEGRLAAEGYCNVALSQEENGQIFDAAENFERFYELVEKRQDWLDENDKSLYYAACNYLSLIYTSIAEHFAKEGDVDQNLAYLQKACSFAKEGDDLQLSGLASFRLGVAYEQNGRADAALEYISAYMDCCKNLGDKKGFGRACEALAKAYVREGKIGTAIEYLELFVNTAEADKDDKSISKACSNLGAMFNSMGRYDQAVEYFNKAYNIARAMNDTETISSSRVLFGVAAAHKMMSNVSKHVRIASHPCIDRLLEWKDSRGDEFDKTLPGEDPPEPEPESEPVKESKSKTEPEGENKEKEEEEEEEEEEADGEEEEDGESPNASGSETAESPPENSE